MRPPADLLQEDDMMRKMILDGRIEPERDCRVSRRFDPDFHLRVIRSVTGNQLMNLLYR